MSAAPSPDLRDSSPASGTELCRKIGALHRGTDSCTGRVFVRCLIARPRAWGYESRTARVFVQRVIIPTHLKTAELFWRGRLGRTLSAPCWTNVPLPNELVSVPLTAIHRTLSQEEMRAINALGFPMYAMVQPGTLYLPNVIVTCQPKTRKELGEIIRVKALPDQMPSEQREQLEDHNRLMAIFQKSRLDLFSQSAVYSVVILGNSVREVAEASGLRARTLSVAVSRIRSRM